MQHSLIKYDWEYYSDIILLKPAVLRCVVVVHGANESFGRGCTPSKHLLVYGGHAGCTSRLFHFDPPSIYCLGCKFVPSRNHQPSYTCVWCVCVVACVRACVNIEYKIKKRRDSRVEKTMLPPR